MTQRLEAALEAIDKTILVKHAQCIKGQRVTMSEPFSAGEYWICFEMIAEDGDLIIARVRLPRHPDVPSSLAEEEEAYAIQCELAAMKLVKKRLPAIPVPTVYAYEGHGSQLAADVGAIYMLMEGFYGNTLVDVAKDMCSLPLARSGTLTAIDQSPTQEHIITQWTRVQAELATLKFDKIGAIASVSDSGEAKIGKLPGVDDGDLPGNGPLSTASDFFMCIVNTAENIVANTSSPANRDSNGGSVSALALAAVVFRDIIKRTPLFDDVGVDGHFPLNHMDLGAKNILVDDDFNFVAIIDWEFAQTAPWQVNCYPKSFPQLGFSDEAILRDPTHPAYNAALREEAARRMYNKKFRDAERQLEDKERGLGASFAETLDSPASRIYACFNDIAHSADGEDDKLDLVRAMARLAFGLDEIETERLWPLDLSYLDSCIAAS
ncbi:Uncharacterized protein TPAR_02355 [Tolypocladium paradoxum]|uniref:Uncharacterized protein n=1 Tax=Tolypocladium paradoxum TaxID=94208 RepID=A0A2S4L4W5_9HYPO|nr:Uncharacterized protein TPAR_02355 [Tolypocladium paradoxum]